MNIRENANIDAVWVIWRISDERIQDRESQIQHHCLARLCTHKAIERSYTQALWKSDGGVAHRLAVQGKDVFNDIGDLQI